jgi:hypothetical protein
MVISGRFHRHQFRHPALKQIVEPHSSNGVAAGAISDARRKLHAWQSPAAWGAEKKCFGAGHLFVLTDRCRRPHWLHLTSDLGVATGESGMLNGALLYAMP